MENRSRTNSICGNQFCPVQHPIEFQDVHDNFYTREPVTSGNTTPRYGRQDPFFDSDYPPSSIRNCPSASCSRINSEQLSIPDMNSRYFDNGRARTVPGPRNEMNYFGRGRNYNMGNYYDYPDDNGPYYGQRPTSRDPYYMEYPDENYFEQRGGPRGIQRPPTAPLGVGPRLAPSGMRPPPPTPSSYRTPGPRSPQLNDVTPFSVSGNDDDDDYYERMFNMAQRGSPGTRNICNVMNRNINAPLPDETDFIRGNCPQSFGMRPTTPPQPDDPFAVLNEDDIRGILGNDNDGRPRKACINPALCKKNTLPINAGYHTPPRSKRPDTPPDFALATSMINEFLDLTSAAAFCNQIADDPGKYFEDPSVYDQGNYTPAPPGLGTCSKDGPCFVTAVSDESIGEGPSQGNTPVVTSEPTVNPISTTSTGSSEKSQTGQTDQVIKPKSKIPKKTKTGSNRSATEKAGTPTRTSSGHKRGKTSSNKSGSKRVKKKPPPDPKKPKTKEEEEKKLEDTKQDSINMLSVAISTVMLLAAGIKTIPENYISWTYKYLKCIKNCQGQHPANIRKILKMLNVNQNDDRTTDKNCACPSNLQLPKHIYGLEK